MASGSVVHEPVVEYGPWVLPVAFLPVQFSVLPRFDAFNVLVAFFQLPVAIHRSEADLKDPLFRLQDRLRR